KRSVRECRTDGEDGESHHLEGGTGATSRSSVKLIHSGVSKFNQKKRGFVVSTGWRGTLHIPELNKLNLKLDVFLLTHVDIDKRAIVIHDDRIPI
uniref:Uncharacterized protein n=1 Tax=Aegilops tauschii subsp. strangulata TaxID=200361 RepID=A0A453BW37_AEGTS